MIKFNTDIYVLICNLINFIIPLYCLYKSVGIFNYIDKKNRFERYYNISVAILCVFYLILLFRFSILEKSQWEIDFIYWSIFETIVFVLFLLRIKYVKQCNTTSIK